MSMEGDANPSPNLAKISEAKAIITKKTSDFAVLEACIALQDQRSVYDRTSMQARNKLAPVSIMHCTPILYR